MSLNEIVLSLICSPPPKFMEFCDTAIVLHGSSNMHSGFTLKSQVLVEWLSFNPPPTFVNTYYVPEIINNFWGKGCRKQNCITHSLTSVTIQYFVQANKELNSIKKLQKLLSYTTGFLTLPLLTFWDRWIILCWGAFPVCCMLGTIHSPVRCQQYPSNYDNQKCLWRLQNVPWGVKTALLNG